MTFNTAAWAIDGATLNSALARTQAYTACSGSEGIIQRADLKVTQLDTPGNGLKISAGSASILNFYLGAASDQMYTVSNPSVHTLGAGEMPASNPSPQNYVVCIVIGDPEYSAAGHPFMVGGVPAPGDEDTFVYVRPMVLTASAFAARNFPAIALATLAIPASTTTITNAYITDARVMSQPRTFLKQGVAAAPAGDNYLNVVTPTWEKFPNVNALTTIVPTWAKWATVIGFVEGLRLDKAGVATLRPAVVSASTTLVGNNTNVDEYIPNTTKDRRGYNFSGKIDVSSVAGTSQSFALYGNCASSGANQNALLSQAASSVAISVYFEEAPI